MNNMKNKTMKTKKIKLNPDKELRRVFKDVEKTCGFSLIKDSRITELVEARSVAYQILNKEKKLTTYSISNSLSKIGLKRDRSSITHSLLNFKKYYRTSEFTRNLYNELTENETEGVIKKPNTGERLLSELEQYLITLPVEIHKSLLDTVKIKVYKLERERRDRVKTYESLI